MAKLPRLESRDVLLTFARISKVCKMPNEGERARYDVVKTQCGICWLAYQRFASGPHAGREVLVPAIGAHFLRTNHSPQNLASLRSEVSGAV